MDLGSFASEAPAPGAATKAVNAAISESNKIFFNLGNNISSASLLLTTRHGKLAMIPERFQRGYSQRRASYCGTLQADTLSSFQKTSALRRRRFNDY
ncbi:MAG: hypothetical protein KUA39_20155 [Desulfarculus sp.]|nr:hypothetical protein [Desulfarculus sp.]